MQGDGAQQSPGHGACHHTHAETSAHEPEVASPIFPIGDVGDIGASNRTCGAGDAGHDASGVEDRDRLGTPGFTLYASGSYNVWNCERITISHRKQTMEFELGTRGSSRVDLQACKLGCFGG